MNRQRAILAILSKFGPQTFADLLARLGCTRTDLNKALDALTDAAAVTVNRNREAKTVYTLHPDRS